MARELRIGIGQDAEEQDVHERGEEERAEKEHGRRVLAHDDRSLDARVRNDLADRRLDRLAHGDDSKIIPCLPRKLVNGATIKCAANLRGIGHAP